MIRRLFRPAAMSSKSMAALREGGREREREREKERDREGGKVYTCA